MERDLTIAGKYCLAPQNQRRSRLFRLCLCLDSFSTSSSVLAGFLEEVPHKIPLALSQGGRESRKSQSGSGHCLLLRQESGHSGPGLTMTAHKRSLLHLPRYYCARFLSWQIPARPQLPAQLSVAANQVHGCQEKERGAAWTRVPSSVNEPEVDSPGAVFQSGDGPGREPSRTCVSRTLLRHQRPRQPRHRQQWWIPEDRRGRNNSPGA